MSQMDFLALAQRAYRESGFVGSGPVAVTGQVGRNADVVQWVLDAHEEIQGLRRDWSFDWSRETDTLSAGKDDYDPVSDFGITGGVREFVRSPCASYVYPTASGVQARNFLRFHEWEAFRGMNVPVVQGTTPVIFSRQPDGKVIYYPRPSAGCTVVHEVYLNKQLLVDPTDTPRIPADFHMAIVWKAVMLGAGKTNNYSRWDTAEEHHTQLLDRMLRECTPIVRHAGPLA